jgi:[acyl-carrier-protein] S-malonyltransferase
MSPAAAWVGDRAIPVALVDERIAELRAGPYAARLPDPHSAEGRTMRRWLVQVLATEAVVEHEAGRLGLAADGAPPGAVTLAEALRTGGVVAAVTAAHPLARRLRDRVAPHRAAGDGQVRDYYERNRDRYPGAYAEARAEIAARLGAAERERRFARWLDERFAALVRLAPGFEHPGDPRHPDATHRH